MAENSPSKSLVLLGITLAVGLIAAAFVLGTQFKNFRQPGTITVNGGAWIGNLTALAPYKPLFVAATAGMLGYGFYLVYWKPRQACADGAACRRAVPSRLVQIALWFATVLVVAAFAFDYVAPLLLSA